MRNLRGRVKAVEKVTGAPTPAMYAAGVEARREDCRRWQAAFIRGEVLPLPAGVTRWTMVVGACLTARTDGVIGPADHLDGMTDQERERTDTIYRAILAAVDRDLAAEAAGAEP